MSEVTQVEPFSRYPQRSNPETFYDDGDIFISEFHEKIIGLNAQIIENKAFSDNCSTKAESASNSANTAQQSALIAQAAANFKGVWVASRVENGITLNGYNQGQSVQGSDGFFYVCNVTHTVAQNPTSTSGYWVVNVQLGAVGNIMSPLLDIPLRNSLAVKNGVGDCTFSRASKRRYIDMYGVMAVAEVDQPCFSKDGYTTEGSSTNFVMYSNEFITYWGAHNCYVDGVTNECLDPMQTHTAIKLVVTGEDPYIYQIIVFNAQLPTFSIYVAANNQNTYKSGRLYLSRDNFDESHAESFDFDSGITTRREITTIFNGVPTNTQIRVDFSPEGAPYAAGDIFYLFGAQLEHASTASSYIGHTENIPLSRAADILTVPLTYNCSYGTSDKTIVCEFLSFGQNIDFGRIFDFGHIAYHMARTTYSGLLQTFLSSDAISQTEIVHNKIYTIAMTIENLLAELVEVRIYVNGTMVAMATATPYMLFSPYGASISIGHSTIGSEHFNGCIRSFKIYNEKRTPAEVALLCGIMS